MVEALKKEKQAERQALLDKQRAAQAEKEQKDAQKAADREMQRQVRAVVPWWPARTILMLAR
jgi:hypothetical protein